MSRYHSASKAIKQDWYARRLWQPGEKAAGEQACWRAEATLPDGQVWRDSGAGPCPDTIRVPSGAADILVVTDGGPIGPRIIGGSARRASAIDEVLYHGSKADFSSFRPSVSGVRGWGIFLSDSPRYARVFGDIVYACRVRLDNPKTYATSSDFVVDEMKSGDAETLTRELAEDGFDGVVIERSKVSTGTVREVIVFDPGSVTQLDDRG